MIPMLRADLAANESYRPARHSVLDAPITVLGGKDDAGVPVVHLVGWAAHTRGGFSLELLPGGHFFVDSALQALLETVNRKLAEHDQR